MIEPHYHVEHLRSPDAPANALEGLGGGGRSRAVSSDRLGEVFLAPWRAVSLVTLEPGAALGPRTLEASEAMVFVTAGAGTAHMDHGAVALREGIALTLFKAERLHLAAADEGPGLEFFFAEIGTDRPAS